MGKKARKKSVNILHARAGWTVNDLARGNLVDDDLVELSNARRVTAVANGAEGA